MSTLRPTSAKIMQHAEGLGTPSPEQVRHRARELALIAGRTHVTVEEWQEAIRELHGGHDGASSADDLDLGQWFSERDMVFTDSGHHVANLPMEDAVNVIEELIAEGMDEAVHEQMLAARRAEFRHDHE